MKGLKFTAANIAELRPAEREYMAWSQDLPGFGIRVLPTGKKSWIVQFRNAAAVSVRKTLGNVKVIPVSLAEPRAQQLLAHARLYGKDLAAEEKADALARLKRRDTTVAAVVRAYLEEAETRAKRSYPEIRRYLETVWAPIHDLDAEEMTRHDLSPTLRTIASERGGTTANRAKACLSAMLTWAITHSRLRRENSPTAFLPSWDEQPRERALSLEELGQIWSAAPLVNEQFGRMVKMLILTGCRRGEIAGLEWQQVDFGRGVIELPSSRTKNQRPYVVPLAPAAVAILANTPRISDHIVFPNFRSWAFAKRKLDDLIGLKPAWVVHDIRRSVSTGLHEHLNGDGHLIELLLNHASGTKGSIAGVYDRSQRLADRREYLTRWSELILEAAGEPVPAADRTVVGIRR